MREHKAKKGWAIFTYIGGSLMTLFFLVLLVMIFLDEGFSIFLLIFAPLALGLSGVMIWSMIETFTGKYVLTDDTISLQSFFRKNTLSIKEIEGFSRAKHHINIISKVDGKKSIKLSPYVERHNEILEWLYHNTKDLDAEVSKKENEDIFFNPVHGSNHQERVTKLKQARKVARTLNVVGFVSLIWYAFHIKYYGIAIIIGFFLPILTIIAMHHFKGLIKVNTTEDSQYPNAMMPILYGACILGIKGFDFNILNHAGVWLPTFLIGLVLTVTMLWATKELSFKGFSDGLIFLAIWFFCSFYGYGVVTMANCLDDRSMEAVYEAEVLDKWVDGPPAMYTLELSPYGEEIEESDLNVSKKVYWSVDLDETVEVIHRKGRFGISWAEVKNP